MYEDLNTLEQFHYSNGLLYNNTESYVLQERGTETESIQIEIKVDKFKQNPPSFPLCSDLFILKLIDRDADQYGYNYGYNYGYGYGGQNQKQNKNYELYLAPPLNSRKIVNAPEFSGYIEYFLHSDDHIIIRMTYINGFASINMINQNGLIYDSKIMNINPGGYLKTKVSRDGKYILFISVNAENKYNTQVYEIDREVEETKSSDEEAMADKEKDKANDPLAYDPFGNVINNNDNNDDKGIYENNKIKITEINEIENYGVEAVFDEDEPLYLIPNKEMEWKITNTGAVIGISFNQKALFINGHNHYDQLETEVSKLIRDVDRNEDGTLPIYKWNIHVGEDYVIVHLEDRIFSFRFNVETGIISNIQKIKHDPIYEYKDITLERIITTTHKDYFLIVYKLKKSYNIMIWDLVSNKEVGNFNSREDDQFKFYIHGREDFGQEEEEKKEEDKDKENKKNKKNKKKNEDAKNEGEGEGDKEDGQPKPEEKKKKHTELPLAEIGYAIFDKYIVNLDNCLPNPFFKFEGDDIPQHWNQGRRMNNNATLLLINGILYSSFSYQDIYFRRNRDVYATKRVDACRYFINRKSVIYDYIMDDDKLANILPLIKSDPIYYLMILMQDNYGKTPLQEAIDNNSPRIVELFLNHFQYIQDFKISGAFYKEFPDLFEMGIEAFRSYLATCAFSTAQMDMMKKLEMQDGEETRLYYSNSSILGEKFNKMFLTKEKDAIAMQKQNEDNKKENAEEDSNSLDKEDGDENDDETLLSDVSIDEFDDKETGSKIAKALKSGKEKNEKRVEVVAIEFDWVLNTDDGEQFLKNLSNTDNLAYFEIDIIKNIVLFQWSRYLPRIILFLFTPFLLFFILFILYTTWIYNEKVEEGKSEGDWDTIDFWISIAVLVFQIFFIYVELNQMCFHGWDYIKSFWNSLDLISIGLNIACAVADLLDIDNTDFNAIACVAVLVLWFRLFYLLRVFSETAYLISMVEAIVIDMTFFVGALLVAIIAFANTFYILGRNSEEENFAGKSMFDAFIFSYKMGLGDFDTDGFNTSDETLIWVLWFLNTLIILIILLNLVIAIMGDTFDRVQETRESTKLQEFSQIMRENNFIIKRKRLFRDTKYIIIIRPETAEGNVATSWEGKINQLKRFLEESSSRHIAHLNKMEKKLERMIEDGLDEKLKPTEDKINQKIQGLEMRLQKVNKVFNEYSIKDLRDKVLKM